MDESISPFLTASSRAWAKNLPLRSAIVSAIFLFLAYVVSHFHPTLSDFFLLFVFFLSGTPSMLRTIEDLQEFTLNIDILMTLAAFLSVFIGAQLEGGLLLVLFNLSGAMEEAVSKKAMGALHNLHKLAPTMATVVEGNTTRERSVKEIAVDTKILIKAGEVIPLDGKIVSGQSFVNMVHLTGESVPVSKGKDDEVQAGARNMDGTLTVAVTKTSAESTLSRIITLIKHAQETKPTVQRFLDRFSQIYATTIIGLFFLFAIGIPLVTSVTYLGNEGAIYRALTFLIAASPCALIIATPTAYLSAISACAKSGVLMKGGVSLDALASASVIAFDKTGTLTTGELTCQSIEKTDGPSSLTEDDVLVIAAALEQNVTHPIGIAICQKAQGKQLPSVDAFTNVPGFGIEGTVTHAGKSHQAFIGNAAYIKQKTSLQPKEYTQTATYLFIDESLFSFTFFDVIRPQMKNVLTQLHDELSLETVMLTGDHKRSADTVAQAINITTVHADLRPEEKLKLVEKINEEKQLAMVGDGINDAPALARSTVGISMGGIGSATAIDASDIVLLNDNITLLPYLVRKAKKTTRIIRQNLTLALSVICIVTTPALLGIVPLWMAVILHEGGTLLVGLNSLRLLRPATVD